MNIGMLFSRIRIEEKMLLEAAAKRDITVTKIKDDDVNFELVNNNGKNWKDIDVFLCMGLIYPLSLFCSQPL